MSNLTIILFSFFFYITLVFYYHIVKNRRLFVFFTVLGYTLHGKEFKNKESQILSDRI